MARIGIDCRFASLFVGLGTYTRNMVQNLVVDSVDTLVLFVQSKDEKWLREVSEPVEILEAPYAHYSFAEQIQFPSVIRKSKIELLYVPHFNVPYFCPVPFVATVHDLILHKFPNNASFIKRSAYKLVINRALSKARHIIAVSEFTKSEIGSAYGSNALKKTSVVTEGIDAAFTETDDRDILKFYDLESGYFLFVGTAKQHKNVQMLIDAHELSGTGTPLIIVTNGEEADRLLIHDGVRVLLGVDTEELPALYSGAGCFVTASLYEGFCLPILEARACGCPVIAVNASAIPEVAGSNARLIEPTIDAIADALKNPPSTSDTPEDRYNWNHSAKEISAILTDALHG